MPEPEPIITSYGNYAYAFFEEDLLRLGDNPESEAYKIAYRRADSFYAAIRDYWPALPDGSITTAYSGCRPKISLQGQPAADFQLDGPARHGHAGLVHLFGIESPGLTSSLAIADAVSANLG